MGGGGEGARGVPPGDITLGVDAGVFVAGLVPSDPLVARRIVFERRLFSICCMSLAARGGAGGAGGCDGAGLDKMKQKFKLN